MIGTWLMLLCLVAVVFLITQAWRAWTWHHRGRGARAAHVEYARMRSEREDTAEARLPEADFVRYYVGLRPGPARYALAALLLTIGLTVSCALMGGWLWN